MKPTQLYAQAYRMLENVTPLSIDCGQLCNKACCQSGDMEDAGMYLFPQEEIMLSETETPPFPQEEIMLSKTDTYPFLPEEVMLSKTGILKIEDSAFIYGASNTPAKIAICNAYENGKDCDRHLRPLSCRIFPLTPYKKPANRLQIIIDPRAKVMCPLAKTMDIDELDERFVETVGYIFRVMEKNSEIRCFIEDLSGLLDEYMIF